MIDMYKHGDTVEVIYASGTVIIGKLVLHTDGGAAHISLGERGIVGILDYHNHKLPGITEINVVDNVSEVREIWAGPSDQRPVIINIYN